MSRYDIVKILSKGTSQYKLKYVGEAFAWECLRYIGIDGARPDVHLRRFFGSERIGASPNVISIHGEVTQIVEALSARSGLLFSDIDSLIWSYCSKGNGEICEAKPKCSECVIRSTVIKIRLFLGKR